MDGQEGALPVVSQGRLEAALELLGLRLVVHPEDCLLCDRPEGIEGRLGSIEHVPHVALRGEDQRLEPRLVVRSALLLEDELQPQHKLLVRYSAKAQDGAAGLDRLNDLGRDVASEREPRGLAEDLHGPPHGLLRSAGHAVGLVEDDDLELALGQGYLLLCEALDLLSHDVDSTVIRGVELYATLLIVLAQMFPGQAVHHGGLPAARWPAEEQVREGAASSVCLQNSHGSAVSDYILELDGPVFLEPDVRHPCQ
mmetsp:Transcript_6775/g.18698  ORF Transcript_6775/g.18698 Transcript_6775/m.18698 type:complete len:254 (+) Transcript_6775:375-1136(+)